jgi:uncharacterized protein YndB with AHSA1/START domain
MLRSPPNAVHGDFTLDRWYEVRPERLYAAWSDPELRAQWFVGPDNWTLVAREFDFRVGGRERLHGRFASGLETIYEARFHVIEPERRIVYAYDMRLADAHHSVSLATMEIRGERGGTRFRYVEQLAFLDGTDATKGTVSRKHGTSAHLDRMGTLLAPPATGAA